MERYHTTHVCPTERLASMHHTILAPLTRRQQLRVARLLALALLPLLLLTANGHAAERLPSAITSAFSLCLTRRRRPSSHPFAPTLRSYRPLLTRTLPPLVIQTSLLLLLLGSLRAPGLLLFLASLGLMSDDYASWRWTITWCAPRCCSFWACSRSREIWRSGTSPCWAGAG